MSDLIGNIIDLLSTIGNGISKFFDYVATLFNDIVEVIILCGRAIIHFDEWFAAMPSIVTSVITTFLGIAVLYKVLGRE